MSKTIVKKRSKQKEIDPKFGVSEWDPAELDVRHTRHGTLLATFTWILGPDQHLQLF